MREIRNVTRTVFAQRRIEAAEVLFVFGSVQGDWDGWSERIRAGWFQRVILTGETGPSFTERGVPIALAMRDELVQRGVSPEQFLLQTRSTNTLEDVTMSLPLLGAPLSIAFAAKSHHSGRCARTLRRFFPDIPLLAHTFDAVYDGEPVGVEDWHLRPIGREMVMGEFERINQYSARGDISLFE